jgi:aminoglycoside phosphotransferase (APT) family kinase protein
MTGATGRTEPLGELPPDARAWVAATLELDETIDAVKPLSGATSSDVFRVTTQLRDRSNRRLVLRWYEEARAARREPDAVVREVTALRALTGTGVPAPRLIASYDGGAEAAAGVLMSEIPGRPRFDLPDPGAMLDVLATIHAVDRTPIARYRYRGYHEDARLDRPSWWRDRPAWERAIIRTSTVRPSGPDRFIHRDFHPGNLLWSDDRLQGVVDWVDACIGPAAVDVAHCRVNLALLFGPERADIVPGDPAWDIELALGILDWEDGANDRWPDSLPSTLATMGAPLVDVATARRRLEAFVRRALAGLG